VRGDDPLEVRLFEKDVFNRVSYIGSHFVDLTSLRHQSETDYQANVGGNAKVKLRV